MDSSFIHADIFFFVTTVCVALLTILLAIAWIYSMKILANVRYISEKAKNWSDKTNTEVNFLIDEVADFRRKIHRNRFGLFALIRLIQNIYGRYSNQH